MKFIALSVALALSGCASLTNPNKDFNNQKTELEKSYLEGVASEGHSNDYQNNHPVPQVNGGVEYLN